MRNNSCGRTSARGHLGRIGCVLAACVGLVGCATTEQTHKVARELLEKKEQTYENPRALASRYALSLEKFGAMLEIYRPSGRATYVQTRTISDSTGLSHPLVGSELPHDITEMVRSAINRIGDRVIYVPFHPDYVLAQAQQGAKLQLTLPNVLITGAITEFDRALSSAGKGSNVNLSVGGGRGRTDAAFERKATSTLSDLSLDLNLVDFEKQVMIPRMQAANTIRVLNQTYEDSFDFAIYGSGFGITSNTRYLQGRHSAIRLLVELSVLEILGRYMAVPYWRCIPGARPDPVVLQTVEKRYQGADRATKVKWIQETLKDYGFDIKPSGVLDDRTRLALDEISAKLKFPQRADPLDPGLFVDLFVNIPLSRNAPVRTNGAQT